MDIFGNLYNYFETGTEGVYWALQKAPSGFVKYASYDDLFILEDGDYLEIYDPHALYSGGQHVVIWSGVIEQNTESLMVKSHFNPEVEQQNICGYWVHWLQNEFKDHEQWCRLFVLGYPAKLVKCDTDLDLK